MNTRFTSVVLRLSRGFWTLQEAGFAWNIFKPPQLGFWWLYTIFVCLSVYLNHPSSASTCLCFGLCLSQVVFQSAGSVCKSLSGGLIRLNRFEPQLGSKYVPSRFPSHNWALVRPCFWVSRWWIRVPIIPLAYSPVEVRSVSWPRLRVSSCFLPGIPSHSPLALRFTAWFLLNILNSLSAVLSLVPLQVAFRVINTFLEVPLRAWNPLSVSWQRFVHIESMSRTRFLLWELHTVRTHFLGRSHDSARFHWKELMSVSQCWKVYIYIYLLMELARQHSAQKKYWYYVPGLYFSGFFVRSVNNHLSETLRLSTKIFCSDDFISFEGISSSFWQNFGVCSDYFYRVAGVRWRSLSGHLDSYSHMYRESQVQNPASFVNYIGQHLMRRVC